MIREQNIMKISVIVPVYNAEMYLEKCVDSILNQTYGNLEVILVDDGSSDLSGNICDNYERKDQRVKVIHKQQGGVCEARNKGLDIASGDCITFVDNDDFILPNMYSELICNLLKNNANISMCSYQLYYEGESIEYKTEAHPALETMIDGLQAMHIFHTEDRIDMIVPWNKLYKKELFDGIRYPVGRTFDDEFVTYKLLWRAEKIVFTDRKFYFFRQRENSITHTLTLKKYTDYLDALLLRYEYFRDMIQNEDLLEEDALFCLEELSSIHFRKSPRETFLHYHNEYVKMYKACKLKKQLPALKRIRYFMAARFPGFLVGAWQIKKKLKMSTGN